MNSELQAIEERERQDRQARDMFAAAALHGMMSDYRNLVTLEKTAEICWAAADAMMRKRGGP